MILKVIDKFTENLKIFKSPSYLFQILCVIENLHASSTFRLVLSVDRVRFPLDCGFISYYSIIIETDKHKEKQKEHIHVGDG